MMFYIHLCRFVILTGTVRRNILNFICFVGTICAVEFNYVDPLTTLFFFVNFIG